VNQLHSVENKSDKTAIFLLTAKLKGVQQDRSLTVSKFFQLARRPGLKRSHPQHCKMRGKASKGLSQSAGREERETQLKAR
jgi:hypothetical protein